LVLSLDTGDRRERRLGGGRPRPLLKRSRRGARGSNGGGPGLGSRHVAEGMGRGPGPTGGRPRPAAGGCAGGRRASARGRGGIGAPMGGTPAQCRSVVKTG
jgi:hypothetical protein